MTISSVPALWAIAGQETVTTFGPAAMPAALPTTTRMVAITATRHPHVVGLPVSWGVKPCGLMNTVMTGLVTRYLRIKRHPFDSFVDSFARRLIEASGDALRLLRHNPNTGEAR